MGKRKLIAEMSPEEQAIQRDKWNASQQKTRNKKREGKSDPLEEQRIHKINEEGLKRRQESGQCFFGEVFPGIDANTTEDALQVAREMARALKIPDVQSGESLLDFERRTFDAWARYDRFKDRLDCCWGGGGGPFLNRKTQTLTPGWGESYWLDHCGGFDRCWKSLPGATRPIDVSGLAPLKEIPKPKAKAESKPVIETSPAPSNAEVLERGRVQLLNQLRMQYDPKLSLNAQRFLYGI